MNPSANVYYAQTMPGVEKIAWLEIRQRFPHAKFVEFLFTKDQNGIIVFEFPGNPARLLELRTTEDIFVLVASTDNLSRDWRDLRHITRLMHKKAPLDHALKLVWQKRGRPTYRVISRKIGRHQYRRIDFEDAVVKGIQQRYGNRWKFVDDNAAVEVWANILGSRLLCGVRLSDRSMRHRHYQRINLPAALRPSVAAAMVFLTDMQDTDVFLEPMCGSGTLMAERALGRPYQHVLGGDVLQDRARSAQRNLRSLSKQRLTLSHWDACHLPLASESIDKGAVNLPFGKQIGSRTEVERLYPCFFAELERVLKPEGQFVILSSRYELVKAVIRRHPRLINLTGYSIAILGQWARLYVVKKAKQ